MESVLKIAPKVLILTGGEPLLVPALPKVLQRLRRELPDVYLIINTHLMTHRARLEECLPFIDRVGTSIDGLGELNTRTRGISGERVLDGLTWLWGRIGTQSSAQGRSLSLGTNTVLTRDNIHHTGALARAIAKVSPAITIHFTPLLPTSHPLSPVLAEQMMGRFRSDLADMAGSLPNVVLASGPGTREGHAGDAYRCCAQFFVRGVDPAGGLHSCKPWRYYSYYATRLSRRPRNADEWASWSRECWQLVRQLLLKPGDPVCPTPCACYEAIDEALGSEMPGMLRHLLERYGMPLRTSSAERRAASRFVRREFNPNFKGWDGC